MKTIAKKLAGFVWSTFAIDEALDLRSLAENSEWPMLTEAGQDVAHRMKDMSRRASLAEARATQAFNEITSLRIALNAEKSARARAEHAAEHKDERR